MGFARWHVIDPEDPEFRAIFPQLVADARLIIDEVSARGVTIRGGFGVGEPIATTERVDASADDGHTAVYEGGAIFINGDEEAEEECESFLVTLDPVGVHATFTKTQHMPYD